MAAQKEPVGLQKHFNGVQMEWAPTNKQTLGSELWSQLHYVNDLHEAVISSVWCSCTDYNGEWSVDQRQLCLKHERASEWALTRVAGLNYFPVFWIIGTAGNKTRRSETAEVNSSSTYKQNYIKEEDDFSVSDAF